MKKIILVLFVVLSGCVVDGENKPTYEFETKGNIVLNPDNPEQFESIGLNFNVKSKW